MNIYKSYCIDVHNLAEARINPEQCVQEEAEVELTFNQENGYGRCDSCEKELGRRGS